MFQQLKALNILYKGTLTHAQRDQTEKRDSKKK